MFKLKSHNLFFLVCIILASLSCNQNISNQSRHNSNALYQSVAKLDTGIIDAQREKEKGVSRKASNLRKLQTRTKGSITDLRIKSLISYIKSEEVVKAVTYRLLVHDLKAIDDSTMISFRTIAPKDSLNLTKEKRKKLVSSLEEKLVTLELEEDSKQEIIQIENISKALRYDSASILSSLEISRIDTTQVLIASFVAESPKLAQFILTTHLDEYLRYSKHIKTKKSKKKIEFYSNYIPKKEKLIGDKKQELEEIPEIDKAKFTQLTKEIEELEKELLATKESEKAVKEKYQSYKSQVSITQKPTLPKKKFKK